MAYKGVGVLFGVLSFFYFTTALKDSVSGGTWIYRIFFGPHIVEYKLAPYHPLYRNHRDTDHFIANAGAINNIS